MRWLLLIVLLFSCEYEVVLIKFNKMQTYTIDPFKHYSNSIPKVSQINTNKGIEGVFQFTRESIPSVTHDQINKLVGYTVGAKADNSVRIGWIYNPVDHVFDLYMYLHHNKAIIWQYIASALLDEKVPYKIYLVNHEPVIEIDQVKAEGEQKYAFDVDKGYILVPYYGGQFAAPNTIKINLSINPIQ